MKERFSWFTFDNRVYCSRIVLKIIHFITYFLTKKLWTGKSLAFLGLLFISLLPYSNPINTRSTDNSLMNTSMANPAAIYCQDLGFEFKIMNKETGSTDHA